MRVVSHPEAGEELEAAALWYEARQPGFGTDFLDEFENTLRRVVAQPERWRRIRGKNRKLNFRRFPYGIVYSLKPDVLYIKAVMHLHRKTLFLGNSVTRREIACGASLVHRRIVTAGDCAALV